MSDLTQPLLHGDLPCPDCGYLRGGIPPERACPECGAAGFEGLVIASGTPDPPTTPALKPLTALAAGLLGVVAIGLVGSFLLPPETGGSVRALLLPCSVPTLGGGGILLVAIWRQALRNAPAAERSVERDAWEVWPRGVRIRSQRGTDWIAREHMRGLKVETRFDLSTTMIEIEDSWPEDSRPEDSRTGDSRPGDSRTGGLRPGEGRRHRLHLRGPADARRLCAQRMREVLGFA